MAEEKDPREEALWEYANEKVRVEQPRGGSAVRRKLLQPDAPPGTLTSRSPVLCCACSAAARDAAADDGGPLPGAPVEPSGGELAHLRCFPRRTRTRPEERFTGSRPKASFS